MFSTQSSHQRCSKKTVIKNFAIFTGKHLCWSYFLIKLLASRSATVLKRDSNTGVFLWILQIFKNTYFEVELQPAICVHRGCNKFQRSEVSELTFVAAFQRDKEIFQSDSNQHYFLIFTSLRCCFAVLLQKDM